MTVRLCRCQLCPPGPCSALTALWSMGRALTLDRTFLSECWCLWTG